MLRTAPICAEAAPSQGQRPPRLREGRGGGEQPGFGTRRQARPWSAPGDPPARRARRARTKPRRPRSVRAASSVCMPDQPAALHERSHRCAGWRPVCRFLFPPPILRHVPARAYTCAMKSFAAERQIKDRKERSDIEPPPLASCDLCTLPRSRSCNFAGVSSVSAAMEVSPSISKAAPEISSACCKAKMAFRRAVYSEVRTEYNKDEKMLSLPFGGNVSVARTMCKIIAAFSSTLPGIDESMICLADQIITLDFCR